MRTWLVCFVTLFCFLQRSPAQSSAPHPPTYEETAAWIAAHFGSLHGATAAEAHSYEFISMKGCVLQYRERETDSVFKNLNETDHTATWTVPLADIDSIKILEKQLWTLEINTHSHGLKVSFQYEYMKEPSFQDTAGVISNADKTSIDLLPRMQKALQRAVVLCQAEAAKSRRVQKGAGEIF